MLNTHKLHEANSRNLGALSPGGGLDGSPPVIYVVVIIKLKLNRGKKKRK